jgi:hypothetical protein
MDTASQTQTTAEQRTILIDTQWIEGAWQGVPLLVCSICQWDTLNGIHAARHQAQHCTRCAPPSDAIVLK